MPVDRVEQSFRDDVAAVAEARRFLRRTAQVWGTEVGDAALVLSELASNAVRHTEGGFRVVLEKIPSGVRIEVTDQSPLLPELRTPETSALNGRGLYLVDRVSAAWGTRSGAVGGKTVWAELATS